MVPARPMQVLEFLRFHSKSDNLTSSALMLPLNRNFGTEEGESLSSRFALVHFGASSLCLDLKTGNFFELNATGALICAALLDGNSVGEVERRLSSEFGISPLDARRDVS